MDLDSIRQARYREPFEPFALRLRDGREVTVEKWERIAISPRQLLVFGSDEALQVIDPAAVESIVYLARTK